MNPKEIFIALNAHFQHRVFFLKALSCNLFWFFLLLSSNVILQFQFVNHCYHFGSDGWRSLLFFHTLSFYFLFLYFWMSAFVFTFLGYFLKAFFANVKYTNQQIFFEACKTTNNTVITFLLMSQNYLKGHTKNTCFFVLGM